MTTDIIPPLSTHAGAAADGAGGGGHGGGWGDINIHIDINMNIDIHIIINMNIEDYIRYYLLFVRYSLLGVPIFTHSAIHHLQINVSPVYM